MRKIPTAILMSGSGSNARKIIEYNSKFLDIRLILSDNPASNYRSIARDFNIDQALNNIYRFYGVEPGKVSAAGRKRFRDKQKRLTFDALTDKILKGYDIELIAAAGYNWLLSPLLCNNYIIVNVHPGDLRVRDEAGKRKYIGLGWIPTAKALLNGEQSVYTTTHLVTAELDGGAIARVSAPVDVGTFENFDRRQLLPSGVTLKELIRDVNNNGGNEYGSALLYSRSKELQEKLKVVGDWREFPITMHQVADYMLQGRLHRDESGLIMVAGREAFDLFLTGGV
ncbi:MAG: hypothetical protein GH155_04740 [Spirochaeta sp.]|nr:hypothetical protein [Spirochaeta sp.]